MQAFDSIDTLWRDAIMGLLHAPNQSSRVGMTREILGYSVRLNEPGCSWLTNERRALSPYYAAAEVLWYMSGEDSVKMIETYASQYSAFAEKDGRAYGAYGKRLVEQGDLVQAAVNALRQSGDTRRCVIGLWRPSDLAAGHNDPAKKDVPCTLTWQFLLRNRTLHMIVNMRSQDVWLGMPYDIFWNCVMQQVVATEVGAYVGQYFHQCGSLHIYDKHLQAAAEARYAAHSPDKALWSAAGRDRLADMRLAALCEKAHREKTPMPDKTPKTPIAESMYELTTRARDPEFVLSDRVDPILRKAAQLYDHSRGH